MSDEEYKVTFNLPPDVDFSEAEISTLRQKFKADVVERLKKKDDDRPVIDDITRVVPPHND
jgi:hypothetical protein